MGLGMTLTAFHVITCPIRALNPLRFLNPTRTGRHDLTHLPCDNEPRLSIKSIQIPKYNAKRSLQSRFSIQNGFRHDLKHLPCDHEPHSSIKNGFRHDLAHLPCDHEPHSSNKTTRIPKHNAKQSVSLTCATTILNLYFSGLFEIQSRFSIQNVFRYDLTHLPSDHEPHSSIKSPWIPKYNAK
ncbi:uncharacterized protein G2W53_041416 [Senna tora]|uniref:Uncharacterized protein n=1 Tax=Senna tora TaxID=362788 RepID=A0A834SH19_9FABA|nr:uncharacterized protein G2W53_041416 [Senna tora]